MATMNIQMLPQLCVHLIKDYLQDVIEDQKKQMLNEYIAMRIEALSYEVIDWIKSEKLKKKELGMLMEATTHHNFGADKREKDWQPDGWRYKRAKASEMEEGILKSIDYNLFAALSLNKISSDFSRDFSVYSLGRGYEIYGVLEYLTAKKQGKKKAIKK